MTVTIPDDKMEEFLKVCRPACQTAQLASYLRLTPRTQHAHVLGAAYLYNAGCPFTEGHEV